MSKHRTHGTIRNRLLAGVLCLALVLGLLPSGMVLPAEAAHWADPYAQQLVEWGVMRGDINGNLNLNSPITRAEFVTMCNRAFGYDKLGSMPFTDVPSSQWYAQDINIAYNAGYFKGTTGTTAAPNASLTREQAAVLIARNLMLREAAGESLGFTDSRTLSEWSRGLISTAVAEGMITGYSDGSFRPFNNITRGEVAAMLVRVIGTPIDEPGDHSLGDVYGNVTISSSNVTLRNTTIAGNLYLTGGIDLGNVLLENVTVLGRIVVSGAGESNASQSSVVLRNVEAEELVVDSLKDQFVTVLSQGVTDIPLTSVRSSAYLNDSSWPGYGLRRIELDGEAGAKLQLAGSIKEVVNLTPSSDLQLVQGSAEKVTIDEYARNSQVLVDTGTRMDELNLDVATLVTGDGDIKNLNVGADGCEVDILPDTVVIRPGLTATIDGVEMGSSAASELSSEPRLLAGYPNVTNIAPTEAEGLFSGNKPGTIYWAISSLSDGSVSEEDLISNPAYGGNIFAKQAGSINATAKTEYARQIKSLVSDGSYYISAILVDGRGNRSPVKVAAFTTPDDTVPAFVGTPEITKATTTVAQVTATANKNCLLYWALLPSGATAPTPQEFKTGSIGGNYGYGSLSVVKNAPVSITVNSRRLQEKTSYDLFLWLTDHNGAQSMATPVKLTITTPDETPPVVTAPVQTGWYDNRADVTFSINEVPSTLYWAIVEEGNETFIAPGTTPEETAEIMSDLRTKIKVESGAGAITKGAAAAATAYADILFTINGLNTATTKTNNYTLYYVGKDAAGNYSEKVGSVSIQTLDTTPPTVKQEFTVYNGDKVNEPLASTGIKLVFSEQVKGGANASQTFLELYNRAADPSLTGDAQTAARNALAKELSDHIRLYSVPRTGSPVLLNPADGYTNDSDAVLDFRNAIVTFENGSLVVFLPGDGDSQNTAIRLDSGATYYIQLLGVFDNAFVPNGVSNTGDPNQQGNLRLDNFTTVYAQVNIEWNTSETAIASSDSNYGDVRLDVVVDVKPTSTSKVPLTECWDMIVWSDTWIGVKVYYIELDETGAQVGGWQCLNANPVAVASSTTNPGVSLGATIRSSGTAATRFPPIATTLEEGHTYRYGFHITEVRGVRESGETDDANSWSDLVTMRFGLIAGSSGGVQTVSGNVGNNFDSNYEIKQSNLASYISTANSSTGTSDILTVPKQFTDTRPPEFLGDYPHFSKTSSTITMDIQLTRPGTVYYVAAPVGEISLSFPNGTGATVINSLNDGTQLTGGATPTGKTYIPTDGADRIRNLGNIYYTSTDGDKTYTNPSYGFITDAKRFYGDNDNVYVPDSPESFVSSAVHPEMTGLKANTWYYIYVVLEGSGGAPDQVVQVYRVKTDPVVKPEINVRGNSETAFVMPTQDAEITFTLVELNALPKDIFGSYYKTGTTPDTTSVIYQMINTVGTGSYQSLFDRDGDATKKKQVYDYITGDVRPSTSVQPVLTQKLFGGEIFNNVTYRDPIKSGTTVQLDLGSYMTSTNSEYVLLVMARHPSGGEDPGVDYAFGAINSLFTPDKKPPELTTMGTTGTYIQASISAYDSDGNRVETQAWRNDPYSYTYSGSVTITYDKPIFVLDNSVRYGIYYKLPSGNTTGKALGSLLGGSGPDNKTVTVTSVSETQIGNSFTLTLTNIEPFQDIVLFSNGRVCNASSYDAPTITLRFDPGLTTYDLGLAVSAQAGVVVGGFRVL